MDFSLRRLFLRHRHSTPPRSRRDQVATSMRGFTETVWPVGLESTEAGRRLLIDLESLDQAPAPKRDSEIPVRSMLLERD